MNGYDKKKIGCLYCETYYYFLVFCDLTLEANVKKEIKLLRKIWETCVLCVHLTFKSRKNIGVKYGPNDTAPWFGTSLILFNFYKKRYKIYPSLVS